MDKTLKRIIWIAIYCVLIIVYMYWFGHRYRSKIAEPFVSCQPATMSQIPDSISIPNYSEGQNGKIYNELATLMTDLKIFHQKLEKMEREIGVLNHSVKHAYVKSNLIDSE